MARAEALKEIRHKPGFAELVEYLRAKAEQLSREIIRRETVSSAELAEVRGQVRALEAVVDDVDQLIAAGEELQEDEREIKELAKRVGSGSGELAL